MAPGGEVQERPDSRNKRPSPGRQRRGRSRSRSPDRSHRKQRRRSPSNSRTRASASPQTLDRSRKDSDRSRHHRRRASRSRSRERHREEARPSKSDTHRSSHHHHHHHRHHRRHSSHREHSERTDNHKRSDSRSRSRSPKRRKRSPSPTSPPPPPRRSRAPLPSQKASLQLAQGHPSSSSTAIAAPTPKEKANFKPTGLLAAETNKVTLGHGPDATEIVLKYHEPAEARKPPASDKWVLFIFKGAAREPLETIHLHERSCWLLGREAAVADVAVAHPSCSKQHAVLQFRYTTKRDEFGERKDKVGLYLLDLESSNGTWLNGERIESARYVGVLSGDVVKFGDSEREYVMLLPPKGG